MGLLWEDRISTMLQLLRTVDILAEKHQPRISKRLSNAKPPFYMLTYSRVHCFPRYLTYSQADVSFDQSSNTSIELSVSSSGLHVFTVYKPTLPNSALELFLLPSILTKRTIILMSVTADSNKYSSREKIQ